MHQERIDFTDKKVKKYRKSFKTLLTNTTEDVIILYINKGYPYALLCVRALKRR